MGRFDSAEKKRWAIASVSRKRIQENYTKSVSDGKRRETSHIRNMVQPVQADQSSRLETFRGVAVLREKKKKEGNAEKAAMIT